MRVVTSAQMKQIEENSLRYDLTFQRLMENAGSAAAAFLRRTFKIQDRNCIIFCAKGNNGGDGLVVARKLTENDVNVVVTLLDGLPTSPEAMEMYRLLDAMGVPILGFEQAADKLASWLTQTDLVVDAICGTGFQGELREHHRRACDLINQSACAVVSLDIPTGVECDSGQIARGAVKADFTLVFDSLKPAHVLPGSKEQCGAIEVLDIGIPDEAREGIVYANYDSQEEEPPPLEQEPSPSAISTVEMPPQAPVTRGKMTLSQAFERIPPRREDSHKGTYGKLVNVAGSARYRGAAILSTLGALRCGTGLVTLCSTEPVCAAVSAHAPEAILLPLAQNDIGTLDGTLPLSPLTQCLEEADAVVFGCGLGNNLHTARLLEHVLKNTTCPVVLDADGINAVAGNIHVLKEAKAPLLLTPHPGEMARLAGCDIAQVEANREEMALDFARQHHVTVVLKGPRTLIASPDGALTVNETGNSGLAKGGSGDLLAGMIGALLAQGMAPHYAAAVGVFLHGMAADRTAKRLSRTAMLPRDVLEDLAGIFLEQGR
ncbi:MAG: NAD(P)H-hydrate dehydratase [Oscillospiraceae bacterium]